MTKKQQIRLLNNIIPNYCQNVVFNPQMWASLSQDEKSEFLLVQSKIFTVEDDYQKQNLLRDIKYNLFKDLKIF